MAGSATAHTVNDLTAALADVAAENLTAPSVWQE
jgi:hypothetical protein